MEKIKLLKELDRIEFHINCLLELCSFREDCNVSEDIILNFLSIIKNKSINKIKQELIEKEKQDKILEILKSHIILTDDFRYIRSEKRVNKEDCKKNNEVVR